MRRCDKEWRTRVIAHIPGIEGEVMADRVSGEINLEQLHDKPGVQSHQTERGGEC